MQKTEELYLSRGLKFHQGNMDQWINVMRLRDGMKILEVGCAGGLLCHRLKERGLEVSYCNYSADQRHEKLMTKRGYILRNKYAV